jgi:hypothetical protein
MGCVQAGVKFEAVKESCPLIDASSGALADPLADKRVDFHFNCLLDGIKWAADILALSQTGVQ